MPESTRAKIRRGELAELATAQSWPAKGKVALAQYIDLKPKSIDAYLSDGFPEDHVNKVQKFFAVYNRRIDTDLWSRDDEDSEEKVISFSDSGRLLNVLFKDVRKFLTVRAPSRFPRVPEKYLNLDDDELLASFDWRKDAPSSKYMHDVWVRLQGHHAQGLVITSVGRVSSLIELWASVQLVRNKHLQKKIGIFLIPAEALEGASQAPRMPIIGARVVNDRKCLLSVPVSSRQSSHTPLLVSRQTAKFIYSYAEPLMELSISRDLTMLTADTSVAEAIDKEFEALMRSGADIWTQYGRIDSFERVRQMTERLLEWAGDGLWHPPLA